MTKARIAGLFGAVVLAASAGAQAPAGRAAKNPTPTATEQQDAETTKNELNTLLDRYPPALRNALGADPSLLGNEPYLVPYPALSTFLAEHPDVARDPAFYLDRYQRRRPEEPRDAVIGIWRELLQATAIFTGFGMAIGLIVWLTRTLVDARRWNRVAKVQTEVHMKLLDRFSNNDELLSYVQSPAGSKFLTSAPILLDAPQRSVGAPLSRILWSLQGGVVLLAGGVGLIAVGANASMAEAAEPLRGLGIVAMALGLGFVISAAASYIISQRLGLIDRQSASAQQTLP